MKPKEIEFLTRTAIIDRMTGPLCDAVLGRTDSAKMLAALEQANMFVVALDHHREWYRYHHLFRDMLLAELRAPGAGAGRRAASPGCCSVYRESLPGLGDRPQFGGGGRRLDGRAGGGECVRFYSDGPRGHRRALDGGCSTNRSCSRATLTLFVCSVRGSAAARTAGRGGALGAGGRRAQGTSTDRCPMEVLLLRPWAALLRSRLCAHGSRHDARRRRDRDRRS